MKGSRVGGDIEIDELSRNDRIPGCGSCIVFVNGGVFQLVFNRVMIRPKAAVSKKCNQ